MSGHTQVLISYINTCGKTKQQFININSKV